jgi:hypothetical protein
VEAEATFSGQLVIMRIKGRQTIWGVCCTRYMLYSVYAALGVNSSSAHGDIVRYALTLCSAMIIKLWTRKREMGDEDEYNMEDTSMRNQEYDMPDLVGKPSYRCDYTPDRDSYLLYWRW